MLYLLMLIIFVCVLGGLTLLLRNAFLEGTKRKQKFLEIKSDYERILSKLSNEPESTQLRTEALSLGRKHYGYMHPDLVRFEDNIPVDCGKDMTVIELKVQSDINARTTK